MTAPVLLVMEEAPIVQPALERDCPGERFLAPATPEELDAVLRGEAPEVAFSIRGGVPGEMHLMLRDHPGMLWLHLGGSGYEHIAAAPGWDPARLTVTNGAGVLAPFLADTCMAAILGINQNLFAYAWRQRAREWRGIRFRALAGQRLLIVGAGAIGTELARRAKALGMHVTGLRRAWRERPDCYDAMLPPEALRDELGEADFVSVHLRMTEALRSLFDARMFAAMKPGAVFLNTARGGLVDEPALIAALEGGHLAAAYLDVCAEEPLPPESPLWEAPNLLISPHSSDGVEDWPLRFAARFAGNLARYRAGQPLENVVTP